VGRAGLLAAYSPRVCLERYAHAFAEAQLDAALPMAEAIASTEVAIYPGDLRGYQNWRVPERLAALVERPGRISRSRSGSDPIEVYDPDSAERAPGYGEGLAEWVGMSPLRYGPPGRILKVP
jgi:hypothetical protein